MTDIPNVIHLETQIVWIYNQGKEYGENATNFATVMKIESLKVRKHWKP